MNEDISDYEAEMQKKEHEENFYKFEMKKLLGNESFKKFINKILDFSQIYSSQFNTDSNYMYFRCGKQSVGKYITDEIIEISEKEEFDLFEEIEEK